MGVHSFRRGPVSVGTHDTRVSKKASAARCGNKWCPGDCGRTARGPVTRRIWSPALRSKVRG